MTGQERDEAAAKAAWMAMVDVGRYSSLPPSWECQTEGLREDWIRAIRAAAPILVAGERERCVAVQERAALLAEAADPFLARHYRSVAAMMLRAPSPPEEEVPGIEVRKP